MDWQIFAVWLLVALAATSVAHRWWLQWRRRGRGCPLCPSCAKPAVGSLESLSEAPRRR